MDIDDYQVSNELPYKFPQVDDKSKNIIKVIGVGGGGGNAVWNMFQKNVSNVSYAIMNTDSQALANSEIPTKITLGKTGLGVGGNPELGKAAAEFSVNDIKALLEDGTKMVFITAGMGGGTGTGAAPVIASVAREMGILTVGIVTIPFKFEKRLRIEKALKGVEEMKKSVDSLLVINNERLLEIYADGVTTVEDAFHIADDVLTVATRSVAEIITIKGKVNRDFKDVQTVMQNGGGAIISEGRANGENRILKAMKAALESPLFNKVEIEKAQSLLYVIYQSHKSQVKVSEITEINTFMDQLAGDLEVLWGLYWDDSLESDEVKVVIIGTGFDKERRKHSATDESDEQSNIHRLMSWYYDQASIAESQVIKTIDAATTKKEEEPVSEAENKVVEEFVPETDNTEEVADNAHQTTDISEEENSAIEESVSRKSGWRLGDLLAKLSEKVGDFLNDENLSDEIEDYQRKSAT